MSNPDNLTLLTDLYQLTMAQSVLSRAAHGNGKL